MIRDLTCIECPTGCAITAVVEEGHVAHVEGYGCRRGYQYAISEIEDPVRVLTSTVAASGLVLRVVPVKTSAPVPRAKIPDIMKEIRAAQVCKPVDVGDVVLSNVLGLGVDVIATREAHAR
jgi:CxxC motif-containing protein